MADDDRKSTGGKQRIRDLVKRQVVTIQPAATLAVAAERMRRHDVGCLPVVQGKDLVGMITDRDIVFRSIAENMDVDRTNVRQIMTCNPLFCHADNAVDRIKKRMIDHQIKRLPVLDRRQRLVGIISFGDIVGHQPQLRPLKVTFYKMINDPVGHRHKVVVARTYLPPTPDSDQAASIAIAELEQRHDVKSWAQLADAYDIETQDDDKTGIE